MAPAIAAADSPGYRRCAGSEHLTTVGKSSKGFRQGQSILVRGLKQHKQKVSCKMSGSEITGKVQMKWDGIHHATEQHGFLKYLCFVAHPLLHVVGGLGLLRRMRETYYFISPVDC